MPVPIDQQPYGPDLSSHNGTPNVAHDPDFKAIRAAGADFVFIKKSQGTNYGFGKYSTWVRLAKAANLIVFDYHYLSYNSLPADQVPWYLQSRRVSAETPCVVDFENWSDSGELPRRGEDYMRVWASDFIFQLHERTGHWPILYTYPYFFKEVIGNPDGVPWTNCPLWCADYSHPRPPKLGGWPFHTFHQYTSTGTISGVAGRCDMNRFNGTLPRLRVLAGL